MTGNVVAQWLSMTGNVVAQWLSMTGNVVAQWLSMTDNVVAQWLSMTGNVVAQWLSMTDNVVAQWLSMTGNVVAQWLSMTGNVVAQWLSMTGNVVAQWLSMTGNVVAQWLSMTGNVVAQWLSMTGNVVAQWLSMTGNVVAQWLSMTGNVVAQWLSMTGNVVAQWLRGRALDSRLRGPGFKSCAAVWNLGQVLFTIYCSNSFNYIDEYLAIDSDEYLCTNALEWVSLGLKRDDSHPRGSANTSSTKEHYYATTRGWMLPREVLSNPKDWILNLRTYVYLYFFNAEPSTGYCDRTMPNTIELTCNTHFIAHSSDAVAQWHSGTVAQWLDLQTLNEENPGSNPVLPCQTVVKFFTQLY